MSRKPRLNVVIGVLVVAALVAGPALSQAPTGHLLLQLNQLYTKAELDEGVYVGSEFCLACHPSQATWRNTKHAVALRRPLAENSLMPSKGVVADFDGNGVDDFQQGLDFNEINSVFNAYKPNAPILSYEAGTYYITIGELRMPVVATQGGTGDWKQRYLLKVPVASGGIGGYSAENYVSPVQYNEVPGAYVPYHPEDWYNAAGNPKFDARSAASDLAQNNGRTYSKKCIGCHTTGVRSIEQTADGEWFYNAFVAVLFDPADPSYYDYNRDGIEDITNIGCEACHGPGSLHIQGGGDPDKIVNPADLETPQANEVCGQCHVRVKSVPNGTHGWPYDDENQRMFIPGQGEPLEDFFTDASGRWPDGVSSRQHHQQYFDFLASQKPDFRFHPVRCDECHTAHGDTTNDHLIRDVIVDDGLAIPTANENDSLCLACHASFGDFSDLTKEMIVDFEANRDAIAEVVSEHTRHPFAPERRMQLSRCSSCHMPLISKSAINYDIHSHSFEAIPPEKNLTYQDQGGMPDSCSVSCHALKANLFGLGITDDIGTWNTGFDRQSARRLRQYFGPNGRWWRTSEPGSVTYRILENAAAPGEVPPPSEDE